MAKSGDKFSAVWVSHSSMGDFIKCPRCYYLHNVYKDPKNRRKMNIVSPALSLGSAVHEAVESLARLPVPERSEFFASSGHGAEKLLAKYEAAWVQFIGKKGGFKSAEEEAEAKARGVAMIERVANNPGPLVEKTVRFGQAKLDAGGMLPNYFLSAEENIILCGKIDWLTYKPEDDSIHILDFKTGKNEEKSDSLQLPIYLLLLNELQKRKVTGASYWYLDKDNAPVEVDLPDAKESYGRVIKVAREVKKARDEKVFLCPRGEAGCFACRPFEKILRGEAEYLGVGEYNQDLFMVDM